MIRYKIATRIRYSSLVDGKWIISLEGIGSLGMSEKPEFKPGDEINLILEGPVDAKSE